MSARILLRGLLAFVAVLLALVACGDDATVSTTGTVVVSATFSSVVPTGAIDTVTVTASRETPKHEEITAKLTKTNGVWTTTIGNLGIENGSSVWSFKGQAFHSKNPSLILFRGQVDNVQIGTFNFGLVVLVLKEVAPPPNFANSAPVIDALSLSTNFPRAGQDLTLSAAAHDADNDALTVQWTVTGPASELGSPAALTTSWRPSAPGAYDVALTVTDTKGAQDGANFTINVGDTVPDAGAPAPTGEAGVTIAVNLWPRFTSFVATNTLLAPAADTTTLTVETSDPDGDAMTYDWSSDCGGAFGDGTTTRTWTGGGHVPGSDCTFHVVVHDGRGGSNHGTLTLHVGTLPTVQHP